MAEKTLDELYDAEWVRGDFTPLVEEFHEAAKVLAEFFFSDAVIDVGCGPGLLMQGLMPYCGVGVRGIEGSQHCIDFAPAQVRPYIYKCDLRTFEWGVPPIADLVVCTEVAEHLDAVYADRLVRILTEPGATVVFTAAPPGQDGHHHVNLQPKSYWIEKFEVRGFALDEEGTAALAEAWGRRLSRLAHMARNVMVFARRRCRETYLY